MRLTLPPFRRRSYPARADSEGRDKPIRFAVRSLGWTEIAEEDLTPERSSKAVNKCIVDLSLGRNDLLDVVGRWGDVSNRVDQLTASVIASVEEEAETRASSFDALYGTFFCKLREMRSARIEYLGHSEMTSGGVRSISQRDRHAKRYVTKYFRARIYLWTWTRARSS